MKKHAYLVTAYNNWELLKKLVGLLDDERNDIYLMIDLKAQDFTPSLLPQCRFARMILMDRIEIYWAHFSQVQAVLNMLHRAFEEAEKQEISYSYFHLLSGVCLPVKSQDYIHSFCDECGKELIAVVPKKLWYCTKRVRFYYPLVGTRIYKDHKAVKALSEGLVLLQWLFRVDRLKHKDITIYNGWDWGSITEEFALYLLSQEEEIRKMFQKTLCPSELWLHTMALNSQFRDRIYDMHDLKKGSMRFIDWERGNPYVWRDNDFDTLVGSPYLFARKFDGQIDMRIIDRICGYVKGLQQR